MGYRSPWEPDLDVALDIAVVRSNRVVAFLKRPHKAFSVASFWSPFRALISVTGDLWQLGVLIVMNLADGSLDC